MTRAEIGRRQILAGVVTLVALSMAGCASIASSSIIENNADLKSNIEPRKVPPHVRAMYRAVSDEQFPVRASRIELVPER